MVNTGLLARESELPDALLLVAHCDYHHCVVHYTHLRGPFLAVVRLARMGGPRYDPRHSVRVTYLVCATKSALTGCAT